MPFTSNRSVTSISVQKKSAGILVKRGLALALFSGRRVCKKMDVPDDSQVIFSLVV
jgi:hypothetical protein